MVHPFVGYLAYPPEFHRQESEVVEILEVNLTDLQDEKNRKHKDIHLQQGFNLKNVPYFDLHQKTVWGATAMILSEWLAVLEKEH